MDRALNFQRAREQNIAETAEDYTELVFDLIEELGEARVGELAARLGVSHVTAVKTVKRLQEQGLIKTADRKPLELTPAGLKLAKFCKHRHRVLVELFEKIGVPRHLAEAETEGVEHHIGRKTLPYIERFLDKGL